MYGVGQNPQRKRGWLVIIGVVILVLVLGGLFFAFYTLVLKKDDEPTPQVTATMIQIVSPISSVTAAPTASPTAEPLPTLTPTLAPTDTPLPSPTLRPPPEVITVGVRARINISEGVSLNLRDQPTLSGSTVITQLVAGREVDVIDAPEDVGDLRWWKVDGGAGRVGWVVEAYGGETWLVPVSWTDQVAPLETPAPAATPTLTATLAAPTAAPVVTSTATPTLAPAATPEAAPTATQVVTGTATATPEGGIPSPTVGGRAQVSTRYQFINLRQDPGLAGETIGQLANGMVVNILEGPEVLDDLRWWKVEDDAGNVGWAAERVPGEVLLVPLP